MVALWHGVFDFFTASEATQAVATIPAIMSVAITVWATAIVVWAGPANLSRVAAQAPTPDSTPTPAGTQGPSARPSHQGLERVSHHRGLPDPYSPIFFWTNQGPDF